MLFKPGTE